MDKGKENNRSRIEMIQKLKEKWSREEYVYVCVGGGGCLCVLDLDGGPQNQAWLHETFLDKADRYLLIS